MHQRFLLLLIPISLIGCERARPNAGGEKQSPSAETGMSADTGGVISRVHEYGSVVCQEPGSAWPMHPLIGADWLGQTVATPSLGVLSYGWGMAVADFNGDDWLDVYIPGFISDELFLNDGAGGLVLADASHLPTSTPAPSIGATAVDVDGDGDLDIVRSGFAALTVLDNDGTGHFGPSDVALGVPPSIVMGTAWADYDLDGDLDAYVPLFPISTLSEEDLAAGRFGPGIADRLYENRGAGWFLDQSERLPDTNDGFTFAAGWQDLDADGRPELLIVNDHGVASRSNRAWFWAGDRFVDRSEETALDLALDGMGLGLGDVNADGVPDLAVTGSGELQLAASDGAGAWVRTGAEAQLSPADPALSVVGWGLEFGDVDNDGDLDLATAYGQFWLYPSSDEDNPESQPDALFIQDEDGAFSDAAEAWQVNDTTAGRGLIWADIDRDGHLDLVRRPVFSAVTVDLAQCTDRAWLSVHLSGPGENPFGIGARVRLHTDQGEWTRWMRAGGTSIAASGPPELHFGLGSSQRITALQVLWPDGSREHFGGGFALRQRVRAVYGEGILD